MWNKALTLKERAAIINKELLQYPINSKLLARWQAQKPFSQPSVFNQRLAAAGLSRSAFEAAISLDVLAQKASLDDERDIVAACDRACQQQPDWRTKLAAIKPFRAEGLEFFADLVGPLLIVAFQKLQTACVDAAQSTPLSANAFSQSAFSHIKGQIARAAQRTLLRELHIARKTERLAGHTSEDRFCYFCDLLADKNYASELLQKYPVLARQLALAIKLWEDCVHQLLKHYVVDADALQNKFSKDSPLGCLTDVELEAGDHHCGGKTVSLLHFENGQTIVYKPRSLAVDVAFENLLLWMKQNGFSLDLKSPAVLDQGTYGWAEFIENTSCESTQELTGFFQRQGALLAVLYLLNATDFHHENIIACGAYPVPIDLETLLQPDLTLVGLKGAWAIPGSELFSTVQSVGLLPERIWGHKNQEGGIDMSGMGAEGALSPVACLVLDKAGTDQMCMVRKHVPIPPGKHMVTLNGKPISADVYSADLIAGFTSAYDFIALHRATLLGSNSPLAAFEQVEVRVILRSTFYYALILSDAFHPSVLADGLERDLYFDRLWLHFPTQKVLARIIEAERADMWQNDIPRFAVLPNTRHLLTSSGEELTDFWPQSSMQTMRKKLAAFDAQDRARQLWLVEKTFATLAITGMRAFDEYVLKRDLPPLPKADFLKEAVQIAERLIELSFKAPDGSVSWKTCIPAGIGSWVYTDSGFDLYNGIPGFCLFFGYLGSLSGEARFTHIAKDAWRSILYLLERPGFKISEPGAFTGWGGLLYSAHHLSALADDPAIVEQIIEKLPTPLALVEHDNTYDIVGGAAGFIVCALNLVDAGYKNLLSHAIACGDHLLSKAKKTEGGGLGWHLEIAGSDPLGGYSHGAAGISLSLFRLARLTGNSHYHHAAIKALNYDRSLYCSAEGNWRDMREGPRPGETEVTEEHFVIAWCHGAPGIGLSRLLIKAYFKDADIDAEIEKAVRKTLNGGFGKNHSLCHGDLGNLEFLSAAANASADTQLQKSCEHLAAGIMDSSRKKNWICGFPPTTEPLGLMVGMAGIGYGLLKLAAPGQVPSVLTLDPPFK